MSKQSESTGSGPPDAGKFPPEGAVSGSSNQPEAFLASAMQMVSGACVDVGRTTRCGFGEVIYGEGKSADLIERIANSLLGQQQQVLVTRLPAEDAQWLETRFPYVYHTPAARTLRLSQQPLTDPTAERGTLAPTPRGVAVVTAGSTDRGVALEACETLAWMGVPCRFFEDMGVAGPQRLPAIVPELQGFGAIVVAAGMEGALPSVVAGHVRCPVIGLPTSVGYGAAFGGITAMLGMLTSCAAGVAVVNIDAGFKAGYLAGLMVSRSAA